MPRTLKTLFALWFISQIVLPFTAPLQTCELSDLFGPRQTHHKASSPESSTTPTTNETESEANSFVSPIEVASLRASTSLAVVSERITSGPHVFQFDLSPSSQVHDTILRV